MSTGDELSPAAPTAAGSSAGEKEEEQALSGEEAAALIEQVAKSRPGSRRKRRRSESGLISESGAHLTPEEVEALVSGATEIMPSGDYEALSKEAQPTLDMPTDHGDGQGVKLRKPQTSGKRSRGSARHDPDPEQVGRYEILERVARGGMGVVYRARHPDLDRVFALKVLTSRKENSEEALARFKREAKLAARLDHPSIVRVYDAGSDDGAPFLVMDYVEGPNLDKVIREEGLGLRKAAQITRQIALGLQHAHERGIVHRDLKPENILLDRQSDQPKLTDFGIVKDLLSEGEESKLTRTGFTLGSPCYMSPEQASGDHERVQATSDVYSLCGTLYEMLVGKPPFEGATIAEILAKVIREEPIPPRAVNPAIPVDLELICLKGLEKEPERRYQTMQELAQDLDGFLEGEAISVKPAGLGTKASKLFRRHKLTVIVAALIGVVLLAALGYVVNAERQQVLAARLARQAAVEEAAGLLQRAKRTGRQFKDRQHDFLEAVRLLDGVLRADARNRRAGELQADAVRSWTEYLLAEGEPSMAALVTTFGRDVLAPDELESLVKKSALISDYVARSRAREQKNDLPGALRELDDALSYLKKQGVAADGLLSGDRQRLIGLIEERELARQREALLVRAEAAAEDGGPAAGFRMLSKGQLDDEELLARRDQYKTQARDAYRQRRREVEEAARSLEKEAAQRSKFPRLDSLLETAEGQLSAASEHLQLDELEEALDALADAGEAYGRVRGLSVALSAQERALEAEREAVAEGAEDFAPDPLNEARSLLVEAADALRLDEFARAAQLYRKAGDTFRRAQSTGRGEAAVAAVRDNAMRGRDEARAATRHPVRLRDQAEKDLEEADRLYAERSYENARVIYERCSEIFSRIVSEGPSFDQAFELKQKTEEAFARCRSVRAELYASRDFEKANEFRAEAEAFLLRQSLPRQAIDAFRNAIRRYDRGHSRSEPVFSARQKAERARAQAQALREQVLARKLDWKPAFERGQKKLAKGLELFAEGSRTEFNLAEDRFDDASREFGSILADD